MGLCSSSSSTTTSTTSVSEPSSKRNSNNAFNSFTSSTTTTSKSTSKSKESAYRAQLADELFNPRSQQQRRLSTLQLSNLLNQPEIRSSFINYIKDTKHGHELKVSCPGCVPKNDYCFWLVSLYQ